jgi:protein SCO1/2
MMKKLSLKILILIALSANISFGQAVQENPKDLLNIDVVEHLSDTIPLDLHFTDDNGRPAVLSQYFHQGKPVVLILGYYSCPMLCNLVMNGVSDVVKKLDWLPGKEFQIVSVSIDPTETDVLAKAKKANYLKAIGKPEIDNGWMYLTGSEDQSRALAEAVGFKYYYVPQRKEYAHPAVLVILTENGVISRYLYGIEYKEFDMRMALLEASKGKVGGTLDRIILYCYHYDPEAGSYTVFAGNIMKIGGALTLLIMAALLSWLWLKEHRKKNIKVVTN